ncbi:MAG: restriction endonuclease subunit S [Succinivibrionaceae bacterium]|nr:restriction endonuclease subunit S [Succinivibrionaceae bacterium]MDY6374545.1 restriction endonuclease subunit S [Succinivibrionaceae bacterium]
MTPQELKESILQRAFEGKLVYVSQDSPNIKGLDVDEPPFDIPESWRWEKIGNITDALAGATPSTAKPEYWTNGTISWLASGACQDCDVTEATKLISQAGYDGCSTKMMPPSTVMIALTGATAGKVGFLKFESCGNQSIVGILPCDILEPRYLFYYLMASRKRVLADCVGSAQPHISKGYVLKMLVPIPSIAEQKRIVAKIQELLPLVERYGEAWTKLEEFNHKFPGDMKKSILQQAIQGKLVEQRPEEGTGEKLYQQIQAEKQKLIKAGKLKKEKPLLEISEDEIPFEIPESWKWVRFGDVSSYAQRKEKVSAINISADMWSLDLEDIEKDTGKITNHCLACDRTISGDKVKFKTGNILYSKLRPYLKKVLVAPADGICSSEIVPFVMYGNIEPEYARYFLISPFADGIVNSASYGVKMPRVSTDTMTSLCFPLPPLAEQKRIVAKIEELLPLCEKLK